MKNTFRFWHFSMIVTIHHRYKRRSSVFICRNRVPSSGTLFLVWVYVYQSS